MELDSGNILIAEELFNKALSLDPSFAPAIKGLSKLLSHKGDLKKQMNTRLMPSKKMKILENGPTLSLKFQKNIQNGNRNVQQGLFEEAIKNYELISKAHPYFPDAEFYKGLTRFRQKDIEGVAEYFKKALNIYSDHQKSS